MQRTMPEERTAYLFRDLLFVLILAAAFRLLFLLAMPRVLDTADAVHYIRSAQALVSGGFPAADPKIPVLYPALGAAAHTIIRDWEWALRMVSFCFSVLGAGMVYLLARELFERPAALLSGVIIAIWPWLADYGCRVATEAPAVFFWVIAVWLLIRAMRRHGGYIFPAAIAFFCLHLTRAEGLFLLLTAFPASILLAAGREKTRSTAWRSWIRRMLPFALICGVLLLLNTLYVRQVTGETTANYRIGFILEEFDLLRFAKTAVRTISGVIPTMLGPVLFLFLGVGIFRPAEKAEAPRHIPAELAVLFFAAAQWGASLWVLSPAPRYLMAPLMVLSIWAARGMISVARQAAPLPGGRFLRLLPAAALIAFMITHALSTVAAEHLGRRPREPREYREAGLWMGDNLEAGLVFSRKPQISYYAGMPGAGPALEDSLEGALARAREMKARYIVIDERYAAPALRPLLEPAAAPPSLRHLRTFDTWPEARVVIYALR
jgi:4-amino-4-deoxy-L-arabinose transferase-like glycosyltransferase